MTWGDITPTREEFRALARNHRVIPVATQLLADDLTPTTVYRTLGGGPGSFILESAEHGRWSRWSFVGVASRAHLMSWDGNAEWIGDVPEGLPLHGDAFHVLAQSVELLAGASIEGLPPLTGGFVGALGWDIVRSWEKLPESLPDERSMPRMSMGLVSDLVAIDHFSGTCWLIANAINANNTSDGVDEAYADAVARVSAMTRALENPVASPLRSLAGTPDDSATLNLTREEFFEIVASAKQAILDGDVFQVVPSLRADCPVTADPVDIYRVLRSTNPSPYMYVLHLPDPHRKSGRIDVVGSSPETLVKIHEGRATTFPIAGSRPRGSSVAEDQEIAVELLGDPKERSEHVMLVDLSRNDLAKTCVPGTVNVDEFMAIRRYSRIMHITSTVSGTVRDDVSALDVLAGAFPAGTLSGAPKVRALELITEFEPTPRGLYGGVICYVDLTGNLDMAITIRTAVIADGIATVQSGAGIVADSDPDREFDETQTKAAAVLHAVHLAEQLGSSNPPAATED